MSHYDELRKRSNELQTTKILANLIPSAAVVIVAASMAWDAHSHASIVLFSVVALPLVSVVFHFVWKQVVPHYARLTSEMEKIDAEISTLRMSVKGIYDQYPSRRKSEQFKVAYALSGKSVEDFEKALAVGMKREEKEVFVTAFVKADVVVRVTASIGSPFRCRAADSPKLWKKHVDRLGCDEIRQYHNHPDNQNSTQPSGPDYHSSKRLKSLLDKHGAKLRSFIVYWNQVDEWRIIEYDELGKFWLSYEFDAAERLARQRGGSKTNDEEPVRPQSVRQHSDHLGRELLKNRAGAAEGIVNSMTKLPRKITKKRVNKTKRRLG